MPTTGLFSALSDPYVCADPNEWTDALVVTNQ